jgi:membrane-bound serine protease (ClpP class)
MAGRWFGGFVLAAGIAVLASSPAAAAGSPPVLRAAIDGEINAATAMYVSGLVDRAQSEHSAALVLVMNTPGGISNAMDDIVTRLLGSPVPVVVYVSPPGARADSAGLFVAQAADVVAMAPGSNIGSAHPIDSSGANLGTDLRDKVVNDAVARIRTLATMHGRNPDWCERAVRESVNVSADQAVAMHVADLEARDLPALLSAIDGRSLPRPGAAALTLRVAGAPVEDAPMPLTQQLLSLLLDPNVAYLLFLVAIFGLIAELSTPGAILPGVVGVICAILALIAFASLPVNVAGVLLVLFAFVLFVIDLKAPTHGVLTLGGVTSLVLGSLFLVDTGPLGLGINPVVIGVAALAITGLFAFVLRKAVAARKRPAYDLGMPSAPRSDGTEST